MRMRPPEYADASTRALARPGSEFVKESNQPYSERQRSRSVADVQSRTEFRGVCQITLQEAAYVFKAENRSKTGRLSGSAAFAASFVGLIRFFHKLSVHSASVERNTSSTSSFKPALTDRPLPE
jgi:hypothetical protein